MQRESPAQDQVPAEEKRAALEAAQRSETFARSEQLRALLRYLCEMEMEGRGSELTEYLIGVKALGRPEGYSPLEDSSVRTRTYELRQRLQRLYSTELGDAPVQITLPKGTYVPRFEAAATAPRAARPENSVRWVAGGLVAGMLVTALAGALWQARRQAADPLLEQAWAGLVSPGSEVQICIATPLHMLVSPYMDGLPAGALKFPAPPEAAALFGRYRPLPDGAKLEMQPVQKAVTLGSVQALVRTTETLGRLGASYRVMPETNAPLAAMRRRSLMVLGSPWYSRTAATLLENAHWTTRQDEATREIAIVGKDGSRYLPKRGSAGEYQEVFGLVSVLPNEGGHSAYVLSGLTSVGTHAAALFLSDPAGLARLDAEFRKAGRTAWPKAYQVVVRCRASEDAQLLNYTFEAAHAVE